jgi:hypothetical protein
MELARVHGWLLVVVMVALLHFGCGEVYVETVRTASDGAARVQVQKDDVVKPRYSKSRHDITPLSREEVAELAKKLTPEQYRITQKAGTERPFCGTLLDNKKQGTYCCVVCGLPLFSSEHKFDSGTGWPSFFQPVDKDHIAYERDATFDEANEANLVKHYVILGIAVALEGGGLIVPVVKGADEMNLVGMARAINDIVTRARSKKLSPDDLAGGTFTITNPGPFGSIISVPIIPRGQTAILGFEAIEKRVVVTEDDAIAVRSRGFLSLSWDHRIIDGAEAARFLARLKERVETTDFSAELSKYL